ncbi:MAG: hypothetical protein RL291_972 [Pseudomonadota bacterium]
MAPMTRKLVDDCFVPTAPRLSHAMALALLKDRTRAIAEIETVAAAQGLGRNLAVQVKAQSAVPNHTNAAVDGYAFLHAAYDASAGSTLPVSGRAAAGRALEGTPRPGHAVRIFTGAALPSGVDTVAMQEDCTLDAEGRVAIPGGLKVRANVRRAGEDVAEGIVLFEPGHRLRPQDLAALASIGRADVQVFKRLRVGILSTGDEVIAPGQPLKPGQVYDANTPLLTGLLATQGVETIPLGIAADDPTSLDARLIEATRRVDVLLTSGGASMGEEDHMVSAFERLGKRHLWQLAIKPGRPMSFGQIGDTVTVGLPGNPVAVFVCFLMYVAPLLRQLGGGHWREPRRYMLPAAFDFTGRKPGRREFWRGMLIDGPQGTMVDKFARDGSGLISGLRAADGLIDIPEDHGDVRKGERVAFIPLSEFGILS